MDSHFHSPSSNLLLIFRFSIHKQSAVPDFSKTKLIIEQEFQIALKQGFFSKFVPHLDHKRIHVKAS